MKIEIGEVKGIASVLCIGLQHIKGIQKKKQYRNEEKKRIRSSKIRINLLYQLKRDQM